IDAAVDLAAGGLSSDVGIARLGQGWIAEEALAIAIYCALKTNDLEDGIIMAVNHDGDSDSTGAIAGHLLGASHGVADIPSHWLDELELMETVTMVADDLYESYSWDADTA